MVLKEAFRYQNFYDNLINNCVSYLYAESNITNRVQTHLKRASNPDAENEEVVVPKNIVFEDEEIKPNTVVKLMMDLCDQKTKLTEAIAVAKNNASLDIDTAIAMNKTRQKISSVLSMMSNVKARENKTTARANKFNAEGNQTPYVYDVNEVITIDFDRNLTKSLARQLNEASDKASAAVELANITVEVNFTPKYELDDSFEDCLSQVKAGK